MSIIEHLEALERALSARGFPPMSPWWRETVSEFYGTARRQLVLRVGRRGGKSTSLARIACLKPSMATTGFPPGTSGWSRS